MYKVTKSIEIRKHYTLFCLLVECDPIIYKELLKIKDGRRLWTEKWKLSKKRYVGAHKSVKAAWKRNIRKDLSGSVQKSHKTVVTHKYLAHLKSHLLEDISTSLSLMISEERPRYIFWRKNHKHLTNLRNSRRWQNNNEVVLLTCFGRIKVENTP